MRSIFIPSVLGLLLVASTACAADLPSSKGWYAAPPSGAMHPASTTMHGPGDWHGSTTPGMNHASSTHPMPGMGMEMGGFPGTVLTVGTNSFTMDSPRLDNKHVGTTTLTVNVTASTTYNIASSTASFSSISAGEHVVVFGKVSTSTQSIAASRVMILGPAQKPKTGLGGILDRIRNIFGKHSAGAGNIGSSSSAAVGNSGGISGFLHSLFGWL